MDVQLWHESALVHSFSRINTLLLELEEELEWLEDEDELEWLEDEDDELERLEDEDELEWLDDEEPVGYNVSGGYNTRTAAI